MTQRNTPHSVYTDHAQKQSNVTATAFGRQSIFDEQAELVLPPRGIDLGLALCHSCGRLNPYSEPESPYVEHPLIRCERWGAVRKLAPHYSLFALSAALLMTGCSSSNTPNYYSLTPQISPVVESNQVRIIEVLPVGLSDRLNRIPLVIQTPRGESKVLNED